MTPGDDPLGRLWRHWASMLVHDMRAPLNAAHGYDLLVRQGCDAHGVPWTQDQVDRFRSEQERQFAQLHSWLEVTRVCSDGTHVTLNQLLSALAAHFPRFVIRQEGNLDIPSPSEQFGFCLWIFLASMRQADNAIVVEGVVTDSLGRIAINQPEDEDLAQWKEIDTSEPWWFVDGLRYLTDTGFRVDARHKRDDWCIEISWTRGRA